MRFIIAAIIVIGFALGFWQFWNYYHEFKGSDSPAAAAAPTVDVSQLPGLPSDLESPLATAQQHGAQSLRKFLKSYRSRIHDPRLAYIELDYVVLVAKSDLAQARSVFAQVKARTPPDSPVYPRVKALEKTYE